MTEKTDETGAKNWQWKKGQSGNPNGRPIGARQKIAESLLGDLAKVWKAKGKHVLDRLADEDPAKLAAIAFGLLPRDVFMQIDSHQTVTIQEIKRIVIEPGHLDGNASPIAPEIPRQLEYKPGPVGAADDAELLQALLDAMKATIPRDDPRSLSEIVSDDVRPVILSALRMRFG